jgi:ATP/ADP translocase
MSFLALFFLLLSYYLVKPLRDSRFFLYFNADHLPYFYLISPVAALVITKIFNFFVDRMPPRKLLIITYGIMMLCKVLFTVLMQWSSAWSTAVFFVWASVYFSLVLAILWATINSAFQSQQAERCFGIIAIGATLGSIIGAKVSGLLVESVLKDWTLLLSGVSMAVALGFILFIRANPLEKPPKTSDKSHEPEPAKVATDGTDSNETAKKPPGPWDDIKTLLQRPYMRGIAFMVFALALASTVVNLQVYKQIDESLARTSYQRIFKTWDPQAQHFESLRDLKGQSKATTQQKLAELAEAVAPSTPGTRLTPSEMNERYLNYQSDLEGETRKLFANVYFWQGILGIFLLGVVARILFQYAGLSWSTVLLPGFFCLVLTLLFFPLEAFMLQGILIGAGALNYSLNNATKELLYTPTTPRARYQHKPLIEGPIMRLGDVSASLFKIAVAGGAAGTLVLSQQLQSQILLSVGLLASVLWIVLIWYTGRQYDKNQDAETKSQELDLA